MVSKTNRCLGIDIGSQNIRIARVSQDQAGYQIESLDESPLNFTPDNTDEAARPKTIAIQINDMLSRAKIRTRKAVFCIPGQSVFFRRIKLPKTTPDRLERIIKFEARQQIPFPLEKTTLTWQVFDQPDVNEVDVLLCAVKTDYLKAFKKLVFLTGLRPQAISASPLALYNFCQPCLMRMDPQNKKFYAYVNIGASCTEIAIPKPGPVQIIGFTRSVPLGGNGMDQAVKTILRLGDILRARLIRENDAVILSDEFYRAAGDLESINLNASRAATALADSIISELRRSLDFSISQPDGVGVDDIILTGGLSGQKYLAGYITEKLGISVTIVEPDYILQVKEKNLAPFAIATGLALQGLGCAPITIDFL